MKISNIFNIFKVYTNWWQVFLDHFRMLKNEYVTYNLRDGAIFYCRKHSDFSIINEVYVVKIYDRFKDIIKTSKIILDIGGQIGTFSIYSSRLNKRAKIFSFEPFLDNYNIFLRNITLNKADNIHLFNLGVAGKTGKRVLNIDSNNTGGHSIFLNSFSNKKEKINVISFDDFISKNRINSIDFIKMDCEGAEYEILSKCSKTNLLKVKNITMEYHDNYKLQDMVKLLKLNKFVVEINSNLKILNAFRKF